MHRVCSREPLSSARSSWLNHQDHGFFWRMHAQAFACFALDVAGVSQVGLFQLQSAPFRDECVTLIFEHTEPHRRAPAFMPCVDDTQRTAGHGGEYDQNCQ